MNGAMSGSRDAAAAFAAGVLDELEATAVAVVEEITRVVRPAMGVPGSRVGVGTAPGGDVTLAIDELAEDALDRVVRAAGDLAYYSEDRGLVQVGTPRAIFVVDPIDGTRPAAAGFEACCASVAIVPPDVDATLGEVAVGVIGELRGPATYVARAGRGLRIDDAAGSRRVARLSSTVELASMFCGASNRARPHLALAHVLAEMVDASAMGGGFFELGSATYAMTRIVTGQLDAYVDPGQRMIQACPELEPEFRRVGLGAVGVNFPYDIAAAMLIVGTAGGVVSDASGGSLAPRPAVGSGDGFGVSVIAAASPLLHARLLDSVDRGIERVRASLQTPP